MQMEALRLAVEFVPAECEPIQPFVDGVERGFGVALDIGVVDAQHQCAAVLANIEPIKDEGARAANVQIASWGGRKTSPNHEVSVYRRNQKSRGAVSLA